MVRRKKRYILVSDRLNKDRCRLANIYLIEKDTFTIVKCYLSDLEQVKTRLEKEGIRILSVSGTLKSLRERKKQLLIKNKSINSS